METSRATPPGLARKVYGRALLAVPVLWAILFVPAGTLAYWEAWVYLAILLIPMFFVFRYLLKNDPQLLERRMQMREREVAQRRIIKLSYLYFLLAFVLPGLDRRWGWLDNMTSIAGSWAKQSSGAAAKAAATWGAPP
jgi:hypothetical protein